MNSRHSLVVNSAVPKKHFFLMSCILTANMNVDIEVFRSSRAEVAASRLILFVTFCLRDSLFICGPGPICPWSAFAQTRKTSKKDERKSVKQVKAVLSSI